MWKENEATNLKSSMNYTLLFVELQFAESVQLQNQFDTVKDLREPPVNSLVLSPHRAMMQKKKHAIHLRCYGKKKKKIGHNQRFTSLIWTKRCFLLGLFFCANHKTTQDIQSFIDKNKSAFQEGFLLTSKCVLYHINIIFQLLLAHLCL